MPDKNKKSHNEKQPKKNCTNEEQNHDRIDSLLDAGSSANR